MKTIKKIIYLIWWAFNWFAIVFTIFIIIDYFIDKKIEFKWDIIAAAFFGIIFLIAQMVKERYRENNPPGHHVDPLPPKT